MTWKWKPLSSIERTAFAAFGAFAAFAAVSIAMDETTTSDEFIFVVAAALVAAAFSFGALAGRFPEMPRRRGGTDTVDRRQGGR